jgi:hypothetical protein
MSSGFGSSASRPALCWLATLLLCAAFYLGENAEVADRRNALRDDGASALGAYVETTAAAWRTPQSCHVRASAERRDGSNAPVEALQLAFSNALMGLGAGGEARHQSLGCLYGVEVYRTGAAMAAIPSSTAFVSTLQQALSALFIFLFGLALRNKFKS